MNRDIVWQLTRYLLQIVGTYLFARGTITKDVSTMLYSEATVGAVIALGSMAWGFYVRWRTKSVPEAVVKRQDLPVVNTATGMVIPSKR